MMPPQSILESTYSPLLQAYYKQFQANQAYLVKNFWEQWLDPGVKGIASAAPFPGSSGSTDLSAFAPLPLEGAKSVAQTAVMLASGWLNYVNAIKWNPMSPVPPFSAITAVITSPVGAAAAYATLLAGLIAELTLVPPDPASAMAAKATAFATLFHAATAAVGIQITGLGIGSPPPPLVVPLSPVL